jgi:hypothetical protein
MDILETLKHHDTDQLTEWLGTDAANEQKFLDEVVLFSNENPDKIKAYCRNTVPTEFSSLQIVYQALSNDSKDWNEFLFEEVKRIIQLAKNKKINPEFIEVLSDIELESIYTEDNAVYVQMLNYLTSNLQDHNESEFTIELLGIIDWFLCYYEDDDSTPLHKKWMTPIIHLANTAAFNVKMKARTVIMDEESMKLLKSLTIKERIKSIFL